jgi:hypothetical protein
MLWLEREVVATLTAGVEPGRRVAIERYVDGVLRAMPEHLRFGVAGESVVLGFGAWTARRLGSRRDLGDRLDAWERSRVGVIRQYVRLLSSLVMFADQELPREGDEDAA